MERIEQELALLRQRYPDLEYHAEGQWVRLPAYPLPSGWNRPSTPVTFQIPVGYPGTPPYGFYVPAGLTFEGAVPNDYREPAPSQPPFGGTSGIFSWTQDEGWRVTTDLTSSFTLINWVMGFAQRFRQGK